MTDDSLPVDQELVDKAVAVLADPEIGAGVVDDVEGPQARRPPPSRTPGGPQTHSGEAGDPRRSGRITTR